MLSFAAVLVEIADVFLNLAFPASLSGRPSFLYNHLQLIMRLEIDFACIICAG